MPERPRLSAEPRSLYGKKTGRLRRDGVIPANVMERHQPSQSIQVSERELASLVRHGGGGQLVDLEWDGDTQPVLVDQVEIDAVSDRLVHAVFRRVDLSQPVRVLVGIELQGEAPASLSSEVAVIQTLAEVEVSALPTDIPRALVADISNLEFLGDEVRVRDLVADSGTFEPVVDADTAVIGVHATRVAAEDEEVELEEGELEEITTEGEGEPVEGEAADTDAAAERPPEGGGSTP